MGTEGGGADEGGQVANGLGEDLEPVVVQVEGLMGGVRMSALQAQCTEGGVT